MIKKIALLCLFCLFTSCSRQARILTKIEEQSSSKSLKHNVNVVLIQANLVADGMNEGKYLYGNPTPTWNPYTKNQIALSHDYHYRFMGDYLLTTFLPEYFIKGPLTFTTLVIGRYEGFGNFSRMGSDNLEAGLAQGMSYNIPLAFNTDKNFYKITNGDSIKIELLDGIKLSDDEFQIEYEFACLDSNKSHCVVETHQVQLFQNAPVRIDTSNPPSYLFVQ